MKILYGILMAGLFAVTLAIPVQAETPRRLVIVDNDFGVPVAGIQAVPLITSPAVTVLGLTTVAGDSYVHDDVMHTLRFLEIIGRTDIPVYAGANAPLLRTKAELNAWEQRYGLFAWKGAWAEARPGHTAIGPDGVQAMEAGPTQRKPAPGPAATFLIDQVESHPGEVSIMAAGPLTNLALAVRLDPSFAAHVKELVIMGGLVDVNLPLAIEDANLYNDFNFKFDPEAADIVLTAGFPKIRIVATVTNKVRLTPDFLARIVAVKTPLTDYYDRFALKGLPLWDEMASAILLDPALITKTTKVYMRVDTDHGLNYGSAHVWSDTTRPHMGEREVEIIDDIDADRFRDMMVTALQSKNPGH
jgi:inosine-uridine nucleoside N-ribohydrolase